MKYLDQNGNLTDNYYGYIYLTIDTKNNKLYVGQKKEKVEKSKKYFGSGTIIQKIIKKHKKYFLKKIILGVCYNQEELNKVETESIWLFRSYGSDGENYDEIYGYNLTKEGGTCSGHLLSRETKEKLSIANLGHIPTEETRKKLREANRGEKNGMFGKKHSEKSKKEMSIKHSKPNLKLRNREKTKEHCEKISKSKKEKNLIGIKCKNIKNVDIHKIFELRDQGYTKKQISNMLNVSFYIIQRRLKDYKIYLQNEYEIENFEKKYNYLIINDRYISFKGKNNGNFINVDINKIFELKDKGYNMSQIAKELNLDRNLISRRLKNPEKYL